MSGPLLPFSSTTRASFPSLNLPKFPSILTLNLNPIPISNPKLLLSKVVSFGIALSFASQFQSPLPTLAIPFLNSQPRSSSSPLSPPPPTTNTTPFSQAKNLSTGLQNGKIRACPSINPGCISTNPQSSAFAFPWTIPENSVDDAIQELENAILRTQKNAMIQVIEDTPYGKYLKAEVDGGFGRDVVEFLVKGDIVSYRAMAKKVTYVYPFTTALGDSKGQQQRLNNIVDYLGWYAPTFDFND